MGPIVVAVGRSASHSFSKPLQLTIRLTAGQGVDGDAHRGTTVKHRSRVARDPTQPNLRQVHLIHAELHEELRALGFDVAPGDARTSPPGISICSRYRPARGCISAPAP